MKPRHHNHQLAKQIRQSLRRESKPYVHQYHFPYSALVRALPKIWYVKPKDDLDECRVFASRAQAEKYLSANTVQDYELLYCTLKAAKRLSAQNCINFLRRHSIYGRHPYQSYGDMFRVIVL